MKWMFGVCNLSTKWGYTYPVEPDTSGESIPLDEIRCTLVLSVTVWEPICCDYLTKWPKAFATKDQTALIIAEWFVEEMILLLGCSLSIVF